MRELLRLLLCALCVTAIVSEDLLTKEIPKERKEFLRRFLEAGAKARGNGPVAEDRFQEIDAAAVLERQGGVSDDWAKCPAGLAGQDCKNPRCDKRSKLHSHDGTLGHGETLELAYSNECSDNFTFPVDSYVNDIAIYVLSLGQSPPYATLRDPAGKLIDPTKSITEDSNGFRAVYANLAATHGPGSFNVKVSSLSIKSCVIQVWAPSTVVIDGGFVTDKTSDDVQRVMPLPYYAIERNPVDGVPSYLAFKVSAISYPAQPVAVKYFLDTVFQMEHDVITRYNCWASHIVSDPLTCDNAGTYNFKVSGIDSNGYTFQRVYDFECDAEVPTGPTTSPAPTTPPKPATQCFNGGSLINQGQPNATCYCNPLFAGRECEKKLCFNDGIDIDGVCVCADGFSGNHCEDVVCTTLSDGAFDLNQRALVFIVRGGSSMANLIGSVKDAANNIVNLMKGNYFETYILVAFNNHNIEKMISTRDPEEFVNQIGSISTTKDNGCSDGVLGAVSSALSMKDLMKYPHSPVFVFTDGLPDDPRSVQANLLNQLSFFRGELNFIITKDPNQGCAIDTSSDQYLMLRELAQFSQGLVMNGIPLNEIDLVPFNIVYTIQTLNYIHSNDFIDSCNDAPLFQSVFISEGMEGFAFLATGDNLTVTVINPQRKVIKSDNPNTSGDLTLNTYSTDGISGNYLVSVKSATGSPCQYRIGEQANNDLFFSTSKGIHDDSYSMEPLYDASSHVVARINNMPYTEYRDVKAEVLIWTNEPQSDKRKVLFAGSGTYRDSCDYSLYFGSWICETRDMFFYVTVFVNDNQGFTVQRTTTGICSYAIPPSVPPSGCLNGGVADDVTNGTCLCPPNYQGDRCETIICQNNGRSQASGYCSCPAAFGGQFCELPACTTHNDSPDFQNNGRSLTLFVHNSDSTVDMIQSMIDNAAQFIEDVTHQHMNWINHYTIVSFTDKGYFPTCDSDDPNDFINGLKLLKTLTQQSGTSCNNLDILPMMYNAMQERYFTEGGLLFVFLNGVWKTELATYGDVLEISQVSKNPISFFQFSPTAPCGLQSSDNTLKLMQSLAIQTGGEYVQVQQKDAGSVLLSIASLYSSQLIYEAHQDDCSKALVNFYFPTESQTQSISVTFAGSLNGPPTYVKPSGDGKGALNNINVWNNYGISRQDLIIKACENDDWDSNGKQCYLTSTVPLTWIEAQQVCHQNKAVLTSILSKDTQDYLDSVDAHTDYWIGLNDKVKDGDWRWDTLGEYPAKLSGWTNWAPKQPSNSDTERCVFQQGSSSRKWVAADCGQKKPFVCVKHAYDFNYQPHDVTKVHLPRGMWKASVQTFNGPCAIQVRAQSGIRLYTVYTTDVHDDYGMPELADGKKVKNYIAAKVTGLESANPQMPLGNLDFAQMFYNDNMQMVLAEPFKRRSKCAYDYISHDFPCPAASFQITVSGIDSIGFPFQRIIPAMCFPRNTAKQCDNGGVWDKTRAECVCVPGFFGDKCEFAICAPHGNIGAGLSDCICDVGWTGSHCELPMCPGNQTETEDPFLQDTRKSFMVIMDGCNSGVQGDVISKFPDIINAVIAKASDLQDAWFTSFIGIVFRTTASKVPVSPIIKASNVSMFIKRMQDELNINKDTCEMTTDRQMMLALTDIMNEPTVALTPRSQAFLITNGVAGDYAQARPAMDAIAVSHTAVSIISTVGKTMPLASLSDPKIASMTSVAHDSGGAFYQIPDEPTLKKLLTADIGTLFESYHLSSLARKECSGLQEYVQVGGDTKMLVFDIFAQKTPVIHLYDPLNNKVDVTQVVSTATNSFFTVKNEKLPPGLWRVGIDNSDKNMGYCEVNIRGHSEEEIFLAFTQDTGNDNGYTSNIVNYFPQHGFDNAVIAATSFGTMTYAQILTNDERRLLWAAPMIKRSNCAYDYISKWTFPCPAERSFLLAIDGFDNFGVPFRRLDTFHCVSP